MVTGTAAVWPSNELEQIYYLGVFDPQDQIPPTMYRVRVRGQASSFSQTKFASGWVRAELIDSLNAEPRFDKTGLKNDQTNTLAGDELQTGRRLIMFGPEGFREAPKNHRLVIVMGTDPSEYFNAMDQALSVTSDVALIQQNNDLVNQLFMSLRHVTDENSRLTDLSGHLTTTFNATK